MMPASGETDIMEAMASDVDTGEAEVDLSSCDLQRLPENICSGVSSRVTRLLLDYNDLVSLPDGFAKYFPSLEVLSVIGNELTYLPEFSECANCLRELYLNENSLTNLPESVCSLKNLQMLTITGNSLRNVPDNIGDLRNLQKLCLDENKVETLPSTLGLLENLEVLELENNEVKELPVSIGRLKCLRILNLCNNKLQDLPQSLGDVRRLETVDLSGNFIEFLPSHFYSACTLKKFYADGNKISVMPEWISDLSEAVELSLKDNKFHNEPFTEKFGVNCKKLKILDFGGNFMTKLPDTIGQLESLEKFYLGSVIDELERWAFQNGNWLSYLPRSIGDLVNLKEIHLNENLFQELPQEFGNLVNLEYFDIGQNMLHELPESFGNLKSLKFCQLSKNNLQLLPSSFGNLTALEDLRLDNNLLEELPESFCSLVNLKTLDLFNNKLTEIPSAIECFTQLVRMDLNENKFPIPWQEVPCLMKSAVYAKRNPELKDNWRGRARQDIGRIDDPTLKIQAVEEGEEEEESDKEEPCNGYSQDLFRRVAERNLSSSIWRSHTGPQKREKYVHKEDFLYRRQRALEMSQEEENETSNDDDRENYDEFNGDAEYEPPIFQPRTRKRGNQEEPEQKEPKQEFPEPEEDWDAEIEEIETAENPYDDFNNIYQHPAPKTLAEAGYVVDEHLFLPYDIHTEPVIKFQVNFHTEDGQFDDIDDEEDEQ